MYTCMYRIGCYSSKKKENMFWLADDSGPIPDDAPPDMPLSPYTDTDRYPVFRMKYEAVKMRLNKDPKGNTGAHKAVRWKVGRMLTMGLFGPSARFALPRGKPTKAAGTRPSSARKMATSTDFAFSRSTRSSVMMKTSRRSRPRPRSRFTGRDHQESCLHEHASTCRSNSTCVDRM